MKTHDHAGCSNRIGPVSKASAELQAKTHLAPSGIAGVYGDLTEPVQREALFEKASDDQWQRGVHRHDQANAAGESNEKTGGVETSGGFPQTASLHNDQGAAEDLRNLPSLAGSSELLPDPRLSLHGQETKDECLVSTTSGSNRFNPQPPDPTLPNRKRPLFPAYPERQSQEFK